MLIFHQYTGIVLTIQYILFRISQMDYNTFFPLSLHHPLQKVCVCVYVVVDSHDRYHQLNEDGPA